MKFETSKFFKELHPFKLEMPFGNYYFFENFVVAELFEGVHFDWDKVKKLITEIIKFYGQDAQIGFISNRVNHYSIDPQNWTRLEKEYNLIVASAIIMYNNLTYINASIERQFTKKSIKRCTSITEAFDWMLNLKEFN
ncbi:MAG: hypothetical protein NWQ07_08785 [Flaviramulus sp.]|nr:hypothetical protein [Flaviramulus sp.]